MRHVWTMIGAVVIAPLAWVLLAFGQSRSLQAFANQDSSGGFARSDFIGPAICLAAAGLLFGLIATLRFSPLGAVLAGVVYAGGYLCLLVRPDAVLDLLPHSITLAGHHADLTTPLRTGVTLLLGALMLVAVASVGRWRRWPAPVSDAADQTTDAPIGMFDERPVGVDGLDLAPVPFGAEESRRDSVWPGETSGSAPSAWATRASR